MLARLFFGKIYYEYSDEISVAKSKKLQNLFAYNFDEMSSKFFKFTPKNYPMKNKTITLLAFLFLTSNSLFAQLDLSKKIPGIQYESSYNFTAGIEMEMEFYDRKGKHDMTIPYFSFYNSDFSHFVIKHIRKGSVYQIIFDMPNNNCLILMGEGDQPYGSAAAMKDRDGKQLKALELKDTGETKIICGYTCTGYTFEAKEFKGEMWLTNELELPNDVGVLKASKTGAYYQELSAPGFVMEITSITPKGKKTVMKTTAIRPDVHYSIEIPETIGKAINKLDYYAQ
jgi:hypothetical protein